MNHVGQEGLLGKIAVRIIPNIWVRKDDGSVSITSAHVSKKKTFKNLTDKKKTNNLSYLQGELAINIRDGDL